tara:strand:+ start:169 stop:366 length:198 start_codon:yes stop_codon:yes gene_type:complete
MKWYIATLQKEFAKHGFIGCPLTDQQLTTLYKHSVKLEEAYMIGCDVASGFPFVVAFEATLAGEG